MTGGNFLYWLISSCLKGLHMKFNSGNNIVFVLTFLLYVSCSTRQKMVNYDVSYIYHPDKTTVRNRILELDDSLKVFLSYHNPFEYQNLSGEDFLKQHKFKYKVTYAHHTSEALHSDTIRLNASSVKRNMNTFNFSFQIPKTEISPALLLIYKKDLKRKRVEVSDISLDFSSPSLINNYLLINHKSNLPVMNNFLLKEDLLYFTTGRPVDDSLFVFHYDHEFSPAPSPTDTAAISDKKMLTPDSSFMVKVGHPFTFTKTGLYFIQKDSATSYGITYFVQDNKFPQLTTAEEMIEPLIYITTPEEYAKLKSSSHPKISLDSFWLRIGGSKEYSRQLIKSFYQKVEYANCTFTTYKEGWKTDRGIIYIIFGKPDQVYKWGDKEEWVYDNIQTHIITFSFEKKPNSFTDEHYELVRNPEYEKFWQSTIEKWKNGIITK